MSRLIAAIIFVLLLAVACTSPPPAATPAPTAATTVEAQPTAPATAEPTATPSPAPSATPTATATAIPLTPAGIFESLSPAVVRIEADSGFGSGGLITDNYMLTSNQPLIPYTDPDDAAPWRWVRCIRASTTIRSISTCSSSCYPETKRPTSTSVRC